jgi:hypothetical protein
MAHYFLTTMRKKSQNEQKEPKSGQKEPIQNA